MKAGRTALPKRRHGMVLIAVLWIVAALAVIVTGVTHAVRNEARVASVARQSAVAQGLGDAAITLVLQQMVALPKPPSQQVVVETSYRGSSIAVEVTPLNGLIDINLAPPALLAALYTIAGGVTPGAAQALAAATLKVRSQKDLRGSSLGFEAIEDLLRVPGFDYDLYARLFGLVTADIKGTGKVNPLAAPLDVLAVLADGNLSRAQTIASQREAGAVGIDTTGLNSGFIDNSDVRAFRLRARVPLSGGGWLLCNHTVFLETNAKDGLPWRTLRSWQELASAEAGRR